MEISLYGNNINPMELIMGYIKYMIKNSSGTLSYDHHENIKKAIAHAKSNIDRCIKENEFRYITRDEGFRDMFEDNYLKIKYIWPIPLETLYMAFDEKTQNGQDIPLSRILYNDENVIDQNRLQAAYNVRKNNFKRKGTRLVEYLTTKAIKNMEKAEDYDGIIDEIRSTYLDIKSYLIKDFEPQYRSTHDNSRVGINDYVETLIESEYRKIYEEFIKTLDIDHLMQEYIRYMLGTDRSYYDIKNSLEEYVNGNDNSITNYLGFKDAFCKIRKDVLRNYLYENFDNFFKPSSSRAA